MYTVTGQGLKLLHTVDLMVNSTCFPRGDGHTQQVYVPHSRGVTVVSWEDNRLTTMRNLKCVGECYSVGVMSPHTLCACDRSRGSVIVIRVTDDTVTGTLMKVNEVRDKKAVLAAVLGNTILVMYEGGNLVVYESGITNPGTIVTWPAGLQSVNGMSSDGVSRFLICDGESNAVFILDVRGKLCDKINIDTESEVCDCSLGDGKLWVGCVNGDIFVMSPE